MKKSNGQVLEMDKPLIDVGVTIAAPKFRTIAFEIIGLAPYVQLRFSEKARNDMRANMVDGQRAKRGKNKGARDFSIEFPAAMYKTTQGWYGIPAPAFRNAMISACRLVNFTMTRAKLSVFIEADGYDALDGTPLVKIIGEPEPYESIVRNATGVPDIRVRAMWKKWSAIIRIRYDADQFNGMDVTNLLARVGLQVGIGEGRPDSKNSAGLGFGIFSIEKEKEQK
jgi:hypothetical protein